LLVDERIQNGPFSDIADFTERVDSKDVNKRLRENLVRAGAFDRLEPNRRRVYKGIELIMRHASAAAQDRNSNQIGLFSGEDAPMPAVTFPETSDWSPTDRMKEEFEAVGFYLSGHPLDAYGKSLDRIKARPSADIIREGHPGPVNMAGTVIGKVERTSVKGNRYAFIQLSDASGIFEIMVFSELLSVARELFEVGNSLFIKARVQFEGETPKFTANMVEPLDKVASKAQAGLNIAISSPEPLATIQDALKDSNGGIGRGEVIFTTRLEDGREVDIKLKGGFSITPDVLQNIRSIPGIEDLQEN